MADETILLIEDDVPLAELVAATLRREGYTVRLEHRGDAAVERILSLDPHMLLDVWEVRANDVVLDMTASEYDLLEYFARNAGRVIDRDELFKSLRGIEYDGLDRSMDLRISKLRSRLRDVLEGRSPIRTVHRCAPRCWRPARSPQSC